MDKQKSTSEDSVYQKIKSAIRKRYIRQGSQLVEMSLAQQLNVSRTPVRSAIKRLASEGLVNIIPNRGAFVTKPTSREISETFLVRSELEQMAARLASNIITPQQISFLNELIQKEKELHVKESIDEYDQLNITFHLTIAKFSNNSVLLHYISQLLEKTRIYLILFDPFIRLDFSPTIEEHQTIVDALSVHNPEAASSAVRQHLFTSAHGLETAELVPEDFIQL